MNWIDLELGVHESLERIQRVREESERLACSESLSSREAKISFLRQLVGCCSGRSKSLVQHIKTKVDKKQ